MEWNGKNYDVISSRILAKHLIYNLMPLQYNNILKQISYFKI